MNITRKFSNRRYWEKVQKPLMQSTDVQSDSMNFVLVTYNILSQSLLESHKYLYKMCHKDHLLWKNRWRNILCEIKSILADVICFQEVQFSHLDEIKHSLKLLGFETIFKQRTGDKPDGCAISFKKKKFNLVEFTSVEFLQPKVQILKFDNIALMVKLISRKHSNASLVVCTTHLLYNTKRTDARLAQLQVLLAELDKFSYDEENNSGRHLPILLTGDFNSSPQSSVTKLITTGNIKDSQYMNSLRSIAITRTCEHLDMYLKRRLKISKINRSLLNHSDKIDHPIEQDISYFTEEYEHLFNNDSVEHNFAFKSVYDHSKAKTNKLEATVHQNGWVVVDYIYYSSDSANGKLNLLERYYLPTTGECRKIKILPNFKYGSDHFCLAAKFSLRVS